MCGWSAFVHGLDARVSAAVFIEQPPNQSSFASGGRQQGPVADCAQAVAHIFVVVEPNVSPACCAHRCMSSVPVSILLPAGGRFLDPGKVKTRVRGHCARVGKSQSRVVPFSRMRRLAEAKAGIRAAASGEATTGALHRRQLDLHSVCARVPRARGSRWNRAHTVPTNCKQFENVSMGPNKHGAGVGMPRARPSSPSSLPPFRPPDENDIRRATVAARELGAAVQQQTHIAALTQARHAGFLVSWVVQSVWYKATDGVKRRFWTGSHEDYDLLSRLFSKWPGKWVALAGLLTTELHYTPPAYAPAAAEGAGDDRNPRDPQAVLVNSFKNHVRCV